MSSTSRDCASSLQALTFAIATLDSIPRYMDFVGFNANPSIYGWIGLCNFHERDQLQSEKHQGLPPSRRHHIWSGRKKKDISLVWRDVARRGARADLAAGVWGGRRGA